MGVCEIIFYVSILLNEVKGETGRLLRRLVQLEVEGLMPRTLNTSKYHVCR
jgi:hypothetical protein